MQSLLRLLAPGMPDDARGAIHPRLIERLLAGYALEGRCLNAGAGEGMFTGLLDRQAGVRSVVNIDIGPLRLTRASRAAHTAVRADLTRIPFADGVFECALCTEVLEHIPDDRQAVRELARVLKPGALLVISVPSIPAPFTSEHVREGYHLEDLSRVLAEEGFTVERHARAFHDLMRAVLHVWPRVAGRPLLRRLMPRAAFMAIGRLDDRLRIGRPWDLAVVARRDRARIQGSG